MCSCSAKYFCCLIMFCALMLPAQAFAQQGKKGVSLTNDDFPAPTKPQPAPANNDASADNAPGPANTGGKIQGLDLQFRLLDLRLQEAQEPDNKNVHEERLRVESQLRNAPSADASREDARDLQYRQKYVEAKIALVVAEQQAERANTNIQIARRNVVAGAGGNRALDGVRNAENVAQNAQNQVTELRNKLQAIVDEGRREGVGSRAFR